MNSLGGHLNRTPIILGMIGLGLGCVIVAGAIVIFRPDASATFLAFLGTFFAIVVSSIVTISTVGQVKQDIQEVKSTVGDMIPLVNGNMSRMMDHAQQNSTPSDKLVQDSRDAQATLAAHRADTGPTSVIK